MKLKNFYPLFVLLIMMSTAFPDWAPATSAPTGPAMTEVPAAATEAPTAAATSRHGGWLDEIDYSVVDSASAISQIQAGAIDFYSFTLASDAYPAIKTAGLPSAKSAGAYYGISLNPAVF